MLIATSMLNVLSVVCVCLTKIQETCNVGIVGPTRRHNLPRARGTAFLPQLVKLLSSKPGTVDLAQRYRVL